MSAPLSPEALRLFDWLCSMKAAKVRVTSLRTFALNKRLMELQDTGHVSWHTHEPTPWAFNNWLERRSILRSLAPEAYPTETPAPPTHSEQAEPPRSEAEGAGEDGARPAVASSPQAIEVCTAIADLAFAMGDKAPKPKVKRKGPPTMADRAKRFEEERAKREAKPATGGSFVPDRPMLVGEIPSEHFIPASDAKRKSNYQRKTEAPLGDLRYAVNREPKVDIKVNALPSPKELQTEVRAFCQRTGISQLKFGLMVNGSPSWVSNLSLRKTMRQDEVDRAREIMSRTHVSAQPPQNRPAAFPRAYNGAARKRAEERIAKGLPANLSDGVQVKLQQENILRERADAARLADPIEQAKTVIRKRGWACFDASVHLGEKKGRGKYFIGNRLVVEAELLRFAERIAA